MRCYLLLLHLTVQTREFEILFSSDGKVSTPRASDSLRRELDLPSWDSHYKEYERDFLQRKIDILSERVRDLDRNDYDER